MAEPFKSKLLEKPLIVFKITGLFGVPCGRITFWLIVGTAPEHQLRPLLQSVSALPIQVTVVALHVLNSSAPISGIRVLRMSASISSVMFVNGVPKSSNVELLAGSKCKLVAETKAGKMFTALALLPAKPACNATKLFLLAPLRYPIFEPEE